MDHFRNPRNVGVIEDADGIGEAGNANRKEQQNITNLCVSFLMNRNVPLLPDSLQFYMTEIKFQETV